MIKGVLADHLGIGERVLAQTVFPDSAAAKPMKGLVVSSKLVSFRGARSASPESIVTIVVMDSGPAGCARIPE